MERHGHWPWVPWFGALQKGTVGSIAQFNHRIAPAGTRYYYASIEPDVLGMVLHYTARSTALKPKWASSYPSASKSHFASAFSADGSPNFVVQIVRRRLIDYARLGRLLAHDGAWEGKQIIPSRWMIDATKVRPSDAYLRPGRATKLFGYGYLLWLFPGHRRQFALVGYKGSTSVSIRFQLVMVSDGARCTWRRFQL
jgi:hypothetical protein